MDTAKHGQNNPRTFSLNHNFKILYRPIYNFTEILYHCIVLSIYNLEIAQTFVLC